MADATSNPRQTVARILRRWDGIANDQLAAAAAQLAEENDRLREELRWAQDAAESWREDALRMMEDACATGAKKPGITAEGALVLVPASESAVAA